MNIDPFWLSPAVSESSITYDANGNLTGDALWSYTYDEENRLISMAETSGAATAGFPDTTITFKYDYLGRRVEKKVARGTTTESHLRFVWRGWLMVAELNAASDNARVRTYTWGPDISGSFGGAGGNGGVLIVEDHAADEKFYPAYDAQGNVTGLIDTAGNLDAAYEYDPFGKLIRYAGPRSSSMSLLYGTKYTDMETGLIYYGYRYYDPRQGRFINRDPISEAGGINLYGFVGNSPVNRADYLGLYVPEECDPDSDEYDEDNCWQILESRMAIHDLEEFQVIGLDSQEIRSLYSVGDVGEEFFADYFDDYDEFEYNVDNGGDNSPGKDDDPDMEEEEDKEKTDCEKLVNDMIYLADLNNDGGWFESFDLRGDLIDRYANLDPPWGSLFGKWYGQKHQPYILAGATGFRPILSQGGQDTDLLRHVAAGASAELHRLGEVVAFFGSVYDTLQLMDSSSPNINIPFVQGGKNPDGLETNAEIAGNYIGVNVGRHLRGYLEGNSDETQLRASLTKELCE